MSFQAHTPSTPQVTSLSLHSGMGETIPFPARDGSRWTKTGKAALDHGLILKRCVDIFVSLALLIFFAPALVAIAILVCFDSHGPALFAQERIGLGGRKFKCLKFRTMVVDAEAQNLRRDQRVTKVGRILQRTSLDELPQLINVLRGDMSLAGLRSIVEAEVQR